VADLPDLRTFLAALTERPCAGAGPRFGSDIMRAAGLAAQGRVAVVTAPRHGRTAATVAAARGAIRAGEVVAWVTSDGTTILRTEEDLDRVVPRAHRRETGHGRRDED